MNWTYFLEHENASPFLSADVGVCKNVALMKIREEIDAHELMVKCLSHSSLLFGDKPIAEWKIVNNTLEIPLGGLDPTIQILQVTLTKKDKTFVSKLALLPAPQLPNAYIIVGSPRSGTTVVGNMVQRAFETKSHGEAHIAELFNTLATQSQDYLDNSQAANNKGTLVWEMPSILLKAQLVKQLRDTYITYYGANVVVDKTPGLPMLRALPLLILAFPDAKVVYCQRRGIENVASRLRKFPNANFEAHCKQWTQTVQTWQRMKKHLSRLTGQERCYIEIEQFELAVSPKKVTQQIGVFLRVDAQAIKRMFKYQEKKSPQITSGKPSDVSSIERVNWTAEQKQFFLDTCGDAMEKEGYSLDESYYTTHA